MVFGLSLLIGVSLIGCATTPISSEPTKFEGTWKNPESRAGYTYRFTGNEVLFQDNKSSLNWLGTFTFTNMEIIFKPLKGKTMKRWTQKYILSNNILILEKDNVNLTIRSGNQIFTWNSHVYGTFVRQ
jgi:hypothetical protein